MLYVEKEETFDGKIIKNDMEIDIIEITDAENNLLLKQLSVHTNDHPWTSTLTHITGIDNIEI